MSGFRTPNTTYTGGNTAGARELSAGTCTATPPTSSSTTTATASWTTSTTTAASTSRDAEVILQAVERVEQEHPSLVGGVGVYSACCGHGPFTHIDVRGYPRTMARNWQSDELRRFLWRTK